MAILERGTQSRLYPCQVPLTDQLYPCSTKTRKVLGHPVNYFGLGQISNLVLDLIKTIWQILTSKIWFIWLLLQIFKSVIWFWSEWRSCFDPSLLNFLCKSSLLFDLLEVLTSVTFLRLTALLHSRVEPSKLFQTTTLSKVSSLHVTPPLFPPHQT